MEALFVVGAQRSGTTYLYNILDYHPEVCMAKPVKPEPKYFLDNKKYTMGREYYESLYFGACSNKTKYYGEKSTSYMEGQLVPERIKHYYPEARIIMILRDPVERAYSNYKFSVQNGIESLSFADALEAEEERSLSKSGEISVNPYLYKTRGRYINYIYKYLEVFDRSKINVIIHEEFMSNIDAIRDLYLWLGVDPDILPDSYRVKVNSSECTQLDYILSVAMRSRLYKEFEASNKELEMLLGRKIGVWTSD
jgi:hypothetical protein